MLALFLSTLLVAVAYSPALAVDWVTANQATVAWDEVTTDVNGPITLEPGERLTYVVYLANSITDPDKANPTEVGRTQALTYTITLAQKGSYYAGVRCIMEVDDGTGTWSQVSESEVAWSDDPQYVQGGVTFGIRFYPALSVPGGLRPE